MAASRPEPAPPLAKQHSPGDAGEQSVDEPAGPPRIAPGSRAEIGRINELIARALGAAAGGGPPNLFTTLARNRRLFRPWLRFAGALMPGGVLPRADSELVILRVAHNTDCDYEAHHHERLALTAGLSPEEIERVKQGHGAPGWSERQRLLLRAADELHAQKVISPQLWSELRPGMSDAELIELCMLIGHYEMLAMTLKSLGVVPDPPPTGAPARVVTTLQAVIARRQRRRRKAWAAAR